ncbi:MAG: SDR family NAD(P)-dependent oxidoreductase [Blautia marasmi]
MTEAFRQIMERSGFVDIVFNNADICLHKDTLEASVEEFRQVVDVNLTGEYSGKGSRNDHDRKGHKGSIINMASMSGSIVNIPQWQCSITSKAAVIHMTFLAVEWPDII